MKVVRRILSSVAVMWSAPTIATPIDLVPYLGSPEPYFLGNGTVGAGGGINGVWDFLIGPDYTSPNFIKSEEIEVEVDGTFQRLSLEMHRVRKSGVFVGTCLVAGCEVMVSDFSVQSASWLGRTIRVVNRTQEPHNISVLAKLSPMSGDGFSTVIDPRRGIRIRADNVAFCFGSETKNWAVRSSLISFTEPSGVMEKDSKFLVSTSERVLLPGKSYSTELVHQQAYESDLEPITSRGRYDPPSLKLRRTSPAATLPDVHRNLGPERDVDRSLAEWRKWFDSGKRLIIPDAKARDVVEGSLAAVKMQQCRDGGTIAGARKYANSYVRDTHGGVRLFLATGHYVEAKKAIETINHKWEVAGFIPNYWSMGSDSFLGHSFVNDASEITSYFVLMLRDYLAATHDLRFVQAVAPAMKYAVDAPLNFMSKNDWRIDFNGDETEQYCDREDGQEYGGFPATKDWSPKSWSFPSAAIACAASRFYIDYLKSTGHRKEAGDYEAKLQLATQAIDNTFLHNGTHAWRRGIDGSWPTTTVPNYSLIPLWVGARLNGDKQNSDARDAHGSLSPTTGYLPTAPPDVNGFCGHNLGYLLYDLTRLHESRAPAVLATLLTTVGCWGTVSEFYGPGGKPNGHNYRVFESGIDAEAIVKYFSR